MIKGKNNPVSIGFKETASTKDIIFVLNSLGMATANPLFIEELRRNEQIILKEITDEQRTSK